MEPEDTSPWQRTGRTIVAASLRAFDASERTARAGWESQRKRVARWRGLLFMIVQISLAAGISWGICHHLLGHEQPFLANLAAIVCLGFSFGQRLSRALEVAIGVTIGVAFGDLFVHFFGTGMWQIVVVVFLAMSVTTWLGARTIMSTQAAVQAATVLTVYTGVEGGISRWQDALVGCTVAVIIALVAPTSPINRPRVLAAKALHEASATLRAMVAALEAKDAQLADAILARARATEDQIAALVGASNEGMAVVRTSPFLRGRKVEALQISDLVVPLDRYIRNLRVLARRVVVALYRDEDIPPQYLPLISDLAQATDECAHELMARRMPTAKLALLRSLGRRSSDMPINQQLSAAVILAQVRSMMVDLMELCGEPYTDARESVPDMH